MLALYLVAGVALARSAAGQEAVNVAENATVLADSEGHYTNWHGHELNHDGLYERVRACSRILY